MTRTKAQFIGLGIAAFVVLLVLIVNLASGSSSPNWYNNGEAYPAAFAKAAGAAAGEALVPGTGQVWCQAQLGDFAGGRDQDDFGVNLNSPSDPYSTAGTDWISGCAAGFLDVQPSSQSSPQAQPGTPSAGSQSATSSGQPNGWSSGQQVDSSGNGLTSVSCPATSFCMAVDNGGNAYSYAHSSWSGGQQIDTTGDRLVGVSCPTISFCVAVNSGAAAYIYKNGSWSSSSLVGADGGSANLKSISCPTAGVCFAAGSWNVYKYSSGGWASGQVVQEQHWFVAISCPTTTFCMAVDNGGNAYSYSNGSWSSAQQIDSTGLVSVSCASTSFCAAVDSDNDAYVYTNGSWSSADSLTGSDGNPANLTGVSCPAAGDCVAIGDNDVYEYSNKAWSTGTVVQQNNSLASISCSSDNSCIAADNGGNVYSYSGS